MTEPHFLRIWRFQTPALNPCTSDFRVLGLRKVQTKTAAGHKASTRYYDGDDLVVSVSFSRYTDKQGFPEGIRATFQWFTEEGKVGRTKTEIIEKFSDSERQALARRRREVPAAQEKPAAQTTQSRIVSDFIREALCEKPKNKILDRLGFL